ncbi:MAG: hypothetical protein M1814_001100 [Vezdaea aestivalis]|nr:MAG: hypothetical protein M1814_001100 [Vezdaea aestivalis]
MGSTSHDSVSASLDPATAQFDQIFADYVCSDQLDLDAPDLTGMSHFDAGLASYSGTELPADARAGKPHQASPPVPPSSGLEISPYSIYRNLTTKAAITDSELLSLEGRPAQIRPSVPRFSSSKTTSSTSSFTRPPHTRHSYHHRQPSCPTFHPHTIDSRRRHRRYKNARSSSRRMQTLNPPLYNNESTSEWIRRLEMQNMNLYSMPVTPPQSHKSSSVEEDFSSFFLGQLGSQVKDRTSPQQSFREPLCPSTESYPQTCRPTMNRYASAPQHHIPSTPHDSPTHSHLSWTPNTADQCQFNFTFSASPSDESWAPTTPAMPCLASQPQSQPCTPVCRRSLVQTPTIAAAQEINSIAGRANRASLVSGGLLIDYNKSPQTSPRNSLVAFDRPHPEPSGYLGHKSSVSLSSTTSHRRRPSNASGSSHRRRSSGSRVDKASASKSSSGSTKSAQMACGFVNMTPSDSGKILTGVAPSGSSKTKLRREREARERQKKFQAMTLKAAQEGKLDALLANERSVTGQLLAA